MALENGSYINQLDEASPDGLDPKSQGDDHLRLIKKVLKLTFSKITGPVTVNHEQLNSIALPGALPVRGMIMLWTGAAEDCPPGWAICDGTGGTPDLRDRFLFGAGGSKGVLSLGGTTTHYHPLSLSGSVAPHTLTTAQVPPHSHDIEAAAGGNWTGWRRVNLGYGQGATTYSTPSVGGGGPHNHGLTLDGSIGTAEHIPPFVAVFYIMKL